MAEAFARLHGGAEVEAFSAGSRPSGVVHPEAIQSMRAIGYDLSAHSSTGLDDIPAGEFDAVVTMGCGDACPWVPARRHIDWEIPDPKNMEADAFARVRDDIGRAVRALIDEIARTGAD
jgi:protein-tyrosine-phosphatase